MLVYFNNVRGRNHEGLFGPGAFFDLDLGGYQERLFRRIESCLVRGQECIVASYPPGRTDEVLFKTYAYVKWEALPERNKEKPLYRVFFGKPIGSQILIAKSISPQRVRYAPFFNRLGHFKQPSAFCR